MKRIKKITIEIQNIARERGHNPVHVEFAGRSLKERGERVLITCVDCSMWAQGLTNPAPNDIDIGGPLIAQSCSCNVAIIPSDGYADGGAPYGLDEMATFRHAITVGTNKP